MRSHTQAQTLSTIGRFGVWSSVLLTLACLPHSLAFYVQSPSPLQSQYNYRLQKSPAATTSALLLARQNNKFSRAPPVKEDKPVMNDEITANELRVVTPNPETGKDQPLGIMSRSEALQKAQEMGSLDLILINDKSDPPVCKIVDYSKFRYSQEKKAKEVKKMSKATEIKEVKMSYKIDIHDYDVRKKSASKFLKQGNRVKCTVMFRGREVQHDNLGFELLTKLATDLDTVCQKEGQPKREGRNLSLILTPRPEVLKAVNDSRKAGEKAKKKKKQEQKSIDANGKAIAGASAAVIASQEMDDDDDDDEDDYDDDDDEDDDDDDDDLENILGKDELTDKLFS